MFLQKTARNERRQARGIALLANLMLILPFACLALAANHGGALVSLSGPSPRPFDDSVLPAGQLEGPYVPYLGRVNQLNTYMSPRPADRTPAKFVLFTREIITAGIEFAPAPAPPTTPPPQSTRKWWWPFGRSQEKQQQTTGANLDIYEFDLQLLAGSGFDSRRRTIVLIDGYYSTEGPAAWIVNATEEWLLLEDVNVIQVSWADANKGIYSAVVAQTPLIARQITILLHYLAELTGSHLHDETFTQSLHLVGHSLGAHIVGFVGQDLGGRVGRITGLDPAGPSFDQMERVQRLDPSDARFVDVIHTNAGKLRYANLAASTALNLLAKLPVINWASEKLGNHYTGEGDTAWFGIAQPVGHLDYYANNGRVQPGCRGLIHRCDHHRSVVLYVALLRYQRHLRQLIEDDATSTNLGSSSSSKLDQSCRAAAVAAPDYETFASSLGELSFGAGSKCSMNGDDKCWLPIDMVAPARQMVDELGKALEGRQLFFKTLPDGNLVGDLYLLRIGLTTDGTTRNLDKCSLDAQIEWTSSIITSESLAELTTSSSEIVLPLTHPLGAEARLQLEKILASQKSLGQEQTVDELRRLLPHRIKLSVNKAKSRGALQTAFSRLNPFGWGRAPACTLSLAHIEVRPVLGGAGLAGLYSTLSSAHGQMAPLDSRLSGDTPEGLSLMLNRIKFAQ